MSDAVRRGLRTALVGMCLNAVLAAVKIAAGVLGESQALIADGIESTADTIGATAAVATVAGVALHGITSSIRKRKVIHENMEESVNISNPKPVSAVDPNNHKTGGEAS